jgi:hypothetical protein
MYQLKLIDPPRDPVATVTELKEYLRIDNSLEDTRLEIMEAAAVQALEAYTDHKFITQTWDIFLNQWPMQASSKWWDGVRETAISEIVSYARTIKIPMGVVQSFDQFSTYSDDVEFPENLSNYVFDTVGPRGSIGLKLGGVWPTTVLRPINGIRFRVTVGFGDPTLIPKDIKQSVLEFVSHMYENRGDQNEMVIPAHILTLVNHYRRNKLGI